MGGPGLSFTVLSFLLVIGPLVFIHELGHYWVGRWFGVHAEAFSIGFGPEVMHWTDKRGTRWRVGALPLGGYVKFMGDMGVASEPDPKWLELPAQERNRCFHVKPIWQRALIVLAGPVVNLLFAVLVLAGFAYAYGETPSVVGSVSEKSAAAQAGLRVGDRIVAIEGKSIERYDQLFNGVKSRIPGDRIELALQRGGQRLTVPVVLGEEVERDRFGNEYRIALLGVTPDRSLIRPVSLLEAPVAGVRRTVMMMGTIVTGIRDLLTGRRSIKEMGGPLKIAQISGEQATAGPSALIIFMAIISINLGFINLLPIPMLDGGHLLFYGIEAIQRRPVSPRVQEIAFRSGLAFILGLMLLVTVNDLGSFGLWRGLSRLIG